MCFRYVYVAAGLAESIHIYEREDNDNLELVQVNQHLMIIWNLYR